MSKLTRRNHYVPQAYLRFFENKHKKIYFYDKKTKKVDETKTDKIALQKDLYNGVEGENIISWEDFYTEEMDNIYPCLIKELIFYTKNPLLKKVLLINNIKQRLAPLIIMQMLRTPERIFSQKENYEKILEEIEKQLYLEEKVFQREEKISTIKKYYDKKYYKGIALRQINNKNLINKFTKIILNRTWLLYYNNTNIDFITSDNPVVLYNFINKTVGIKNGIGRNDTTIAIPITPRYCILMIPEMYLFGKLKEKYDNECIVVTEKDIIETLNRQQSNNCIRQVYGNDIELLKKYTF